MGVNKDSNSYTVLFAIILVVFVGGLLALIAEGLKPLQKENLKNEKKQYILNSLPGSLIDGNDTVVLKEVSRNRAGDLFGTLVKERIILDYHGNVVSKKLASDPLDDKDPKDAFSIDLLKEYKKYVQTLLDGKETIDPPAGSSKIDQLGEHLEEFCTNRSSDNTTKDDIIRGNVYTEQGKHHFIFSKFYHGFLIKRKWDEKSQLTQQMLKEHFGCKEERPTISKKKITIMTVESFEKTPDNYKPKQFKPKDPF